MTPPNILERFAHDEEFYKESLFLYIEVSQDYYPKVLQSYKDENMEELCLWVHTWKGATVTIGAEKLAQSLSGVELLCRQKNYEALSDYIPRIQNEIGRIFKELPAIIKKSPFDYRAAEHFLGM